jgi:aminocarboxymuconate-semialdehyde decarboxylase
MAKIDIHTHILPSSLPSFKSRFGYGGFVEMRSCPDCDNDSVDLYYDDGRFFRKVQKNAFEAQARIEEMDKAHVTQQVLSTVPVMFNYHIAAKDNEVVSQFLNDHIAEVVRKHPDRFFGLGTAPMQDPDLAAKEAVRCRKDLGLHGIQMGSHINDWNLSARELDPFYSACEESNVALFIHPWDMMGQSKMQKYWLPWLVGMPAEGSLAICSMIFGGVFERFPRLRVAFAHGGGSFAYTLGRIQHGFEARPDLCAVDSQKSPSDWLGHFWVDALVHDPAALSFLIEKVGTQKVCMGTDYPFPLGEQNPGELIESMGFNTNEREWLMSKSALQWLKGV